jgi:hypothetical protein
MPPVRVTFRTVNLGEMTTVQKRAAIGLVALIAAIFVAIAGESSAGAAVYGHAPRPHSATAVRAIRRAQPLRPTARSRASKPRPRISEPRHAARPARPAAKRAAPWTISVPSIGLRTRLTALPAPHGRPGTDLALPVPPLVKADAEAGWYTFSALPGAAGIGPGVFYNLYQLRPRDRIQVDADGTPRRFEVTSVRELPKPLFPVNQVFGSTKRHMLWLITCGGPFDYETRHYLDNIVVSATWIRPTSHSHH